MITDAERTRLLADLAQTVAHLKRECGLSALEIRTALDFGLKTEEVQDILAKIIRIVVKEGKD